MWIGTNMRVQLLTEHMFHLAGGGTITLVAGSIIGASAGDFPLAHLTGGALQVTSAMLALDGAATTALATEATRVSGAKSGIPVTKPTRGLTITGNSTKAWEAV